MTDFPIMHDAAFPEVMAHLAPEAIAGYYGGPRAYRVWQPTEWDTFGGSRKLPVWVAGDEGTAEGLAAVAALHALDVPFGAYTAVDLETRVDRTYVIRFGQVLAQFGYRTWVYGSASTVFANPALNGYWVADYRGIGPFMYEHSQVRATQYEPGPDYDSSTVKHWTYDQGPWWR